MIVKAIVLGKRVQIIDSFYVETRGRNQELLKSEGQHTVLMPNGSKQTFPAKCCKVVGVEMDKEETYHKKSE